jgi:Uma2 family endonuclease
MPPTTSHPITREQCLADELTSQRPRELIDGRALPLAPGTRQHDAIVGNLLAGLRERLGGSPYAVFGPGPRVLIEATDTYIQPDVVVVRGKARFDRRFGSLLNPFLLAEVLSPETELRDRSIFQRLAELGTVREYLLVQTDDVAVELFTRAANGWTFLPSDGDPLLRVASLGCEIPLLELYRDAMPEPPTRVEDGQRLVDHLASMARRLSRSGREALIDVLVSTLRDDGGAHEGWEIEAERRYGRYLVGEAAEAVAKIRDELGG